MTGRIVNYDKAGTNPYSAGASLSLLKELVDENQYQVVNLSEVPNALDDLQSNPVQLFVASGGNAKDMFKDFLQLSSSIHNLVKVHGGRYLGNGAGSIIVSREMLYFSKSLTPGQPNPPQEMESYPPLRGRALQLYSGSSCLFHAPGCDLPGVQLVRKVASDVQPSHYLYSHFGIFFPDASTQPDTEVILESASYQFPNDKSPSLAVKQKVGAGFVLLCGAQPEIGEEVVRKMAFEKEDEIDAQNRAIANLHTSGDAHKNTMRSFLTSLSIATKKV